MMQETDERFAEKVAKLPKWAQSHIAQQDRTIARLKSDLGTIRGTLGESNVWLDDYLSEIPLPKNASIKFTSRQGKMYRVSLRDTYANRDDDMLSIQSLTHGPLAVFSGAANVVHIMEINR